MGKSFQKIKKNFLITAILKGLAAGFTAGFLLVGAVLLSLKLTETEISAWYYVLMGFGGLIVAGTVVFLCLYRNETQLAKRIDTRFGLGEKVQTMLEFRHESGSMIELQRSNASEVLEALPIEKPWWKQFGYVIVAFVLAAALFCTALAFPVKEATGEEEEPPQVQFIMSELQSSAFKQLIEYVGSSELESGLKASVKNELQKLYDDLQTEQPEVRMQENVVSSIKLIDGLFAETYSYKPVSIALYKSGLNRLAYITANNITVYRGVGVDLSNYDHVKSRAEMIGDVIGTNLSKNLVEASNAYRKVFGVSVEEGLSAVIGDCLIKLEMSFYELGTIDETESLIVLVHSFYDGLNEVAEQISQQYSEGYIQDKIDKVFSSLVSSLTDELRVQAYNWTGMYTLEFIEGGKVVISAKGKWNNRVRNVVGTYAYELAPTEDDNVLKFSKMTKVSGTSILAGSSYGLYLTDVGYNNFVIIEDGKPVSISTQYYYPAGVIEFSPYDDSLEAIYGYFANKVWATNYTYVVKTTDEEGNNEIAYLNKYYYLAVGDNGNAKLVEKNGSHTYDYTSEDYTLSIGEYDENNDGYAVTLTAVNDSDKTLTSYIGWNGCYAVGFMFEMDLVTEINDGDITYETDYLEFSYEFDKTVEELYDVLVGKTFVTNTKSGSLEQYTFEFKADNKVTVSCELDKFSAEFTYEVIYGWSGQFDILFNYVSGHVTSVFFDYEYFNMYSYVVYEESTLSFWYYNDRQFTGIKDEETGAYGISTLSSFEALLDRRDEVTSYLASTVYESDDGYSMVFDTESSTATVTVGNESFNLGYKLIISGKHQIIFTMDGAEGDSVVVGEGNITFLDDNLKIVVDFDFDDEETTTITFECQKPFEEWVVGKIFSAVTFVDTEADADGEYYKEYVYFVFGESNTLTVKTELSVDGMTYSYQVEKVSDGTYNITFTEWDDYDSFWALLVPEEANGNSTLTVVNEKITQLDVKLFIVTIDSEEYKDITLTPYVEAESGNPQGK